MSRDLTPWEAALIVEGKGPRRVKQPVKQPVKRALPVASRPSPGPVLRPPPAASHGAVKGPSWVPPLASYDRIIVAFSGGKDSLACVLRLLDLGVPRSKIELWHYDVDGREGSRLMDWPVTRDYCRQVAKALGLPIYFGWKVGGMEAEINRDNVPTMPTKFETPTGQIVEVGGRGPAGTRLKYPQPAGDLSARWCSAYLKIDVASKMITNQPRFAGKRTLIVTGERADESKNRARYPSFEVDRADNREGASRRHVDRWLAVHSWSEAQVWKIIEKYRVAPHPAYKLGWGRVSCASCIFGRANQWASLKQVLPKMVAQHSAYEKKFERNIDRKLSVVEQVRKGTPYAGMDPRDIKAATSERFTGPAILPRGAWKLPAGAFSSETCGPS
jgi:3'-phosphoadenosine 5'-phosphosulfate sulfotransferase (PAPS reductase)/FAD synthetase